MVEKTIILEVFRYHPDQDEEPKFQKIVKDINNGRSIVPTIIFPDGSVLVEPSNSELIKKLNL